MKKKRFKTSDWKFERPARPSSFYALSNSRAKCHLIQASTDLEFILKSLKMALIHQSRYHRPSSAHKPFGKQNKNSSVCPYCLNPVCCSSKQKVVIRSGHQAVALTTLSQQQQYRRVSCESIAIALFCSHRVLQDNLLSHLTTWNNEAFNASRYVRWFAREQNCLSRLLVSAWN